MQWNGRTPDFLDQLFATRPNLLQIGGTERHVRRPGKNQVRNLEITYRPVVRRSQRVDLLRDPQ